MLIVSKATGEWGLAYDATKDLGRTQMTMSKPPALVEDLKYTTHRQRRRQRHTYAGLGERERIGAHSWCIESLGAAYLRHGEGGTIRSRFAALPVQ